MLLHFGVGVPVTAFHCEKPTSLAVTRKEGKGSRRTILPLSGCSGRARSFAVSRRCRTWQVCTAQNRI